MKYYSYDTWKTDPRIDSYVVTFSEEQIIKMFYPYWKEQMIKKFGEERFEKEFTEKDCIEDWMVINWAWEVK